MLKPCCPKTLHFLFLIVTLIPSPSHLTHMNIQHFVTLASVIPDYDFAAGLIVAACLVCGLVTLLVFAGAVVIIQRRQRSEGMEGN